MQHKHAFIAFQVHKETIIWERLEQRNFSKWSGSHIKSVIAELHYLRHWVIHSQKEDFAMTYPTLKSSFKPWLSCERSCKEFLAAFEWKSVMSTVRKLATMKAITQFFIWVQVSRTFFMFPLKSNPINMTSVADEYTQQTNASPHQWSDKFERFFCDIITTWSALAIMYHCLW